MLLIFPWLAWLATIFSAVLLAALWADDQLSGRGGPVLLLWFLGAGYCQFLSASAGVSAAGSGLQTVLAVYLIIRWKFTG